MKKMAREKRTVSIIVPIFNTEKYLRNCLDSLTAQTYKELDIILVDDGSTDRGGIICDEYSAKDSRIRVIHQNNSGISKARNAGLAVMNGEYFVFVDSDDWIDEDYISELMRYASENVDIIASAEKHFYSGVHGEKTLIDLGNNTIIKAYNTREDIINMYLYENEKEYFIRPYAKLYNASHCDARFDAEMAVGEDIVYNMNVLKGSDKIVILNYSGYNVRHNSSSTTNKIASKYTALYEHEYTMIMDKRYEAMRDLGADEEYILRVQIKETPMRYFNEIGNLFKTGSPYVNAGMIRKRIKNIHNDKPFMKRIKKNKTKELCNAERISLLCAYFNNTFFTWFIFKILVRYNS